MLMAIVGYAVSQNPNMDVDALTKNFNWKPTSIDIPSQPELGNAIGYVINGLGAAVFELTKWAIKFAGINPEFSWKLVIILILCSLLAPICLASFKTIVLIVILIKDWRATRKEKKEIKKLKTARAIEKAERILKKQQEEKE